MKTIIRALKTKIASLSVDAIVNAANSSLSDEGGGLNGTIHRAAGPELLRACRLLGGCNIGHAKLTKGYRLPARYVIHAVGPVSRSGASGIELLELCYRRSIELAAANGIATLAFPSISTGAYGYSVEQVAKIAVKTVRSTLEANQSIREVIFCCFSAKDLKIYEAALNEQAAAE
ncbi:MAG: O-acetyl-ADP-ribose deacetylase [Candidatus Accumulibacter sp.]|nr:O-acetyl-ADP-ribose deacetylase [Accumulibacter sp.]